MPELPEVETVRRGLERILEPPIKIQKIELKRKELRFPMPVKKLQAVSGEKLRSIDRIGKYLLFKTEKHCLINHLGMTGTWREFKASKDLKRHDHVLLEFSKKIKLVYNDPRRFGVLDLCPLGEELDHKLIKNMGPDPFNIEALTAESLRMKAKKRIVVVKNFIMDQKILTGVGNIYASEALFRAGIRPSKNVSQISLPKWTLLLEKIREVLSEAIEAGGSTISDFKQAGGSQGYFQNSFKVYGRKDEPCIQCRKPIRLKTIGGRSSFYCSHCQK